MRPALRADGSGTAARLLPQEGEHRSGCRTAMMWISSRYVSRLRTTRLRGSRPGSDARLHQRCRRRVRGRGRVGTARKLPPVAGRSRRLPHRSAALTNRLAAAFLIIVLAEIGLRRRRGLRPAATLPRRAAYRRAGRTPRGFPWRPTPPPRRWGCHPMRPRAVGTTISDTAPRMRSANSTSLHFFHVGTNDREFLAAARPGQSRRGSG